MTALNSVGRLEAMVYRCIRLHCFLSQWSCCFQGGISVSIADAAFQAQCRLVVTMTRFRLCVAALYLACTRPPDHNLRRNLSPIPRSGGSLDSSDLYTIGLLYNSNSNSIISSRIESSTEANSQDVQHIPSVSDTYSSERIRTDMPCLSLSISFYLSLSRSLSLISPENHQCKILFTTYDGPPYQPLPPTEPLCVCVCVCV